VFEGDVPAAIGGDVTRLRQVLLNLLSNAVKFTGRGEVMLTVELAGADEGSNGRRETGAAGPQTARPEGGDAAGASGVIQFSVRDTGIGLSEAGIGKLFQSFSQADSGTTRKYGGTGLGLAISKRLAELMGGTMWVDSAGPGHGSNFHFTIRAAHAELAPAARRSFLGQQPALVLFTSLGRREAAAEAAGLFGAVLNKPLHQSRLFDMLMTLLAHDAAAMSAAPKAKPARDAGMAQRHPLRILQAEDNVVNQKLALRLLQQNGLPRRRGQQRHRSHRVRGAPALRPGADGRTDAGDGRARSVAPHHREVASPRTPTHRRDDCQRHAGRPRGLRD